MKRFSLRVFVLVFACLTGLAMCRADELAAVTGLVTDPNGRSVPGVTVIITNLATNVASRAVTNDQGIYRVPSLQPGIYRMTLDKDGFKSVVKSGVELHVQDVASINFELQIGSVNETVTVEAGGLVINTTDASVSTVVDRQFAENLPLNGRTFQSLIELAPGVVTATSTYSNQGQFNVNGQRSTSNYFSVDGVSANTGIAAGVGLNQTGAGTQLATSILGGMNALVSVDALQEFRIQTSSFAPEYGRTVGAQISIVTRSGTNQFHGDLFDYFRNDALDANNWFANNTGKPKPPLRQNDFGGVFGGPVLIPHLYEGHDKTFFFVSYEGLRLRQPQTAVNFSVPSIAARQAAPATSQPFLNAFPLPNGPDLPNGFAIENATFSNPASFDSTSARIDHSTGRTTFFGRWAYSPSSTASRGGSNPLSDITRLALSTWSVTGGATSTFSSTIANDARVNWTATRAASTNTLDNFGGARVPDPTQLFPSYTSPADGKFQMNLSGTGAILVVGKSAVNSQKQFNALDTVSISLRGHLLKFGSDVRVLRPVERISATLINANFAGVGDPTKSAAQQTSGTFLSGLISSGSINTRPLAFGMQFLNVSSFGQDTWKVTSRLTITYGARWDIFPPPTGTGGNTLAALTSVQSPATLAYAPAGTPLWQTDYKNISPRIGVAFRLRNSSNKTLVLRAGAGVFYDLPSGGLIGTQPANPPNSSTQTIAAGTPFPYSAATTTAPTLPGAPPFANAIGIDPGFQTARVNQWNAALEQELSSFGSASVTYVGAVGRNLDRATTLFPPTVPSATFTSLLLEQSNATSDYHALQLQVRSHLGQTVQALASYALAHSIDSASDDASSAGAPFSRVSPNSERGPSAFDVRHSFSGALTVSSPRSMGSSWSVLVRNWSMDALIQARTGFPFDVVYLRDLGFGRYVFRPDLDPTQPIWIADPSAAGGKRLNTTRPSGAVNQIGAFVVPTTLRPGTLGRNAIRGFGMWQADLGLRRDFHLTDKLKAQFKVEAFNIFNHPNFFNPSGLIAASVTANGTFTPLSTFGRSQSMLGTSLGSGGINGGLSPLYQVGGPRSIQLSLRLEF